MASSDIDVTYVANLARVALNDEEAAAFQREIDAVLAYVRLLSEVDVEGIEPTAHATRVTNVWREDASGDTLEREAVMANAPGTLDEELIRVPVVIGEDVEGGA
jgi:aspartyl-tRNA(Asn)/glutamyl-tRNA(Gln) amidotransferase subunit C